MSNKGTCAIPFEMAWFCLLKFVAVVKMFLFCLLQFVSVFKTGLFSLVVPHLKPFHLIFVQWQTYQA